MSDFLSVLESLACSPRFAETTAKSLFDCGEYGIAATEVIEEAHSKSIAVSSEEKEVLLLYLREYGHGDQDVYDAYAKLLD